MRAAASQAETKRIAAINAELTKEAKVPFLCGSYKLADVDLEHASIFYRETPQGKTAKWGHSFDLRILTIPAYDEEDLAAFHNSAAVSPHGGEDETVYDDSVGLSREFKTPDFTLNFDPLYEETGILQALDDFIISPGDGEEDRKIYAELYEANSYPTGGFFKRHRGTPKSDQHLGTIVVCLPSIFKGGELLVGEDDDMQTLRWEEDCASGKVCWVFLYNDVQHEVKAVTSGYRLTLAYDVFLASSKGKEEWPREKVNISAVPLFAALKSALRDESFFRSGGTLSWAMQYRYPVDREGNEPDLPSRLKGRDRLLYNVLSFLNLRFKIQAVYETEDYDDEASEYDDDVWDQEPLDKFWPDTHRGKLLIGGTFLAGEEDQVGDEESTTRSLKEAGMRFDADVVWCQKPKHFVRGGTYVAYYGNHYNTFYHYVAACIVVYIPPYGEGVRKF